MFARLWEIEIMTESDAVVVEWCQLVVTSCQSGSLLSPLSSPSTVVLSQCPSQPLGGCGLHSLLQAGLTDAWRQAGLFIIFIIVSDCREETSHQSHQGWEPGQITLVLQPTPITHHEIFQIGFLQKFKLPIYYNYSDLVAIILKIYLNCPRNSLPWLTMLYK